VAYSQTRERSELTFAELREQVSRVRAGLINLGVGEGDRVVAYLPNGREPVEAAGVDAEDLTAKPEVMALPQG
jgi:acetoacetyl-CoA synthetase